jgi:hypothetical protein
MTTHYDRETLIDYLHRALAPDTDAAVFAHLKTCAACRAAHDDEAAFGETLRAWGRADEPEMPAIVKARVWEAVRKERPSPFAGLVRAWIPALAVPAAAFVALAIYFATPIVRGTPPPPGISAVYYLDEHNAGVQQNPLGPAVNPAVYATENQTPTGTASAYFDTADAATLDDADAAVR